MKKINWGIIGCGGIANNFSESLANLDGGELVAVASRSKGKAEALAKKFDVATYYNSYEELLEDDRIDVVYVATTHNFHYANVLECLKKGKHVLCEKVFTINAPQARHLQEVAKANNLFLMEAMWTRFLPATRKIMEIIELGLIGEVKFLEAEFSFKTEMDPEGRFYNKELAGGSLMDQGIYPISYASMIFGQQPLKIQTNACMTSTGVDERSTHLFDYGEGKAAMLTTSFAYYPRAHALIAGTKGYIEVPGFFYANEFTVKIADETVHYELPVSSTGKGYEAMEVMNCIRAGVQQSSLMSMDETVEIMTTLDKIRDSYGLSYPEWMEKTE